MRAWVIVLLLLAGPGITGCLAGSDTTEPVQKARAEVTGSLGGVQGVVTDESIQPIVGVNVTLAELSRTARTQSDGSYAFSNVEPGTYTLTVRADGFVSAQQEVTVTPSQVATVDLILAHLAVDEPYTQQWEFAGFFECGLAAGWNLSAAPAPPGPVPDARVFGISTRPCNSVASLSDNTTNDATDHRWQMDAPVETFVFETRWDASTGTLSERFWVDVVIDPIHCANYCNWTILDMNGPSPLTATIDRDRFENVSAHFQEACEEGEDTFCGYDFWEEGWPLWSRVYPRWECGPAPVQACLPLQQSYEHYVTAFFHAPAPEGFRVTTAA